MRCHASQPIVAGSTRAVSSPPPETSLLARSCNKAERERYFVFGEFSPSLKHDWDAGIVSRYGLAERQSIAPRGDDQNVYMMEDDLG
jgi:hypothetical protein